jgi:hypothetical protein
MLVTVVVKNELGFQTLKIPILVVGFYYFEYVAYL